MSGVNSDQLPDLQQEKEYEPPFKNPIELSIKQTNNINQNKTQAQTQIVNISPLNSFVNPFIFFPSNKEKDQDRIPKIEKNITQNTQFKQCQNIFKKTQSKIPQTNNLFERPPFAKEINKDLQETSPLVNSNSSQFIQSLPFNQFVKSISKPIKQPQTANQCGTQFYPKPPIIFNNSNASVPIRITDIKFNEQVSTNAQRPLINRIQKLQQLNTLLEIKLTTTNSQLSNVKRKNEKDQKIIQQMKRDINILKKDLNILTDKLKNCNCLVKNNKNINEMPNQQKTVQGQTNIIFQFKQMMRQFKSASIKRQNQNQKTYAILQKQTKMIENQTIKIDKLEKSFELCFLKNNSQLTSIVNNIKQSQKQHNQNDQTSPNIFLSNLPKYLWKTGAHNQFKNNENGYKQSKKIEIDKNWSSYQEDGYKIRYEKQTYFLGNILRNVEISNDFGKIIIDQSIPQKLLKQKKISEIVKIIQNSCEVIDEQWQNLNMRLKTYNFMRSAKMNQKDREMLKTKIKQEANRSGLSFISLDDETGELCLSTKSQQQK